MIVNKILYTMGKAEVNSVHLFFNISKQTIFVRTECLIKLFETFPRENNNELSLCTAIAIGCIKPYCIFFQSRYLITVQLGHADVHEDAFRLALTVEVIHLFSVFRLNHMNTLGHHGNDIFFSTRKFLSFITFALIKMIPTALFLCFCRMT